MKKYKRVILIAILIINSANLIGIASAAPAQEISAWTLASEASFESGVLINTTSKRDALTLGWFDDFDEFNTEKWALEKGEISIENGIARLYHQTEITRIVSKDTFRDGVLEFRVKIEQINKSVVVGYADTCYGIYYLFRSDGVPLDVHFIPGWYTEAWIPNPAGYCKYDTEWHGYGILRGSSSICNFWDDLVRTCSFSYLPKLLSNIPLHISLSTPSEGELKIDYIYVNDVYEGVASYVFDVGKTVDWQSHSNISFARMVVGSRVLTVPLPTGTSIEFQWAYSNDGITWSNWFDDITEVPNSRFLSQKITITTTDPSVVPILFNSTVLYKSVVVKAAVDFDPDTLNLKSKGRYVTVHIELPEGYDVSDIDISTITLNDQVSAELHPTEIGDYDGDDISDLMVKFNRSDVQDLLTPAEAVKLTVTGEVAGLSFEGIDTIRVIKKGDR